MLGNKSPCNSGGFSHGNTTSPDNQGDQQLYNSLDLDKPALVPVSSLSSSAEFMHQGQQLVSGITHNMDTNVEAIAILQREVYNTCNCMDRLEIMVHEQGQCQEELLKAVLARLPVSSEQHAALLSEIGGHLDT
ncbi:hypothetical protein GGI09_003525 [Coemansia sp. S100]|nr:hypothetical protein LPJ71_000466 [Coemansia sp. S17]KAJ2098023.1 hypothetical protein GGI09_003525 [Coemansia sp. S100]KAJ2109375.1 hypothetical protein GGI16_000754 [Coemansia sp. S142-1]